MTLKVGQWYGPCKNKKMTFDTPYGDVEVTYNYWEDDEVECVTQLTEPEDWQWSGARWFEVQATVAKKLQERGFHEHSFDRELLIWQREV